MLSLASAQILLPIPARSLCNTGLTPKSLTIEGCNTSTPVTPINPVDGGPIVDGNWDIAVPYPSVPYNQLPPDPCLFASIYLPAPVSAPWSAWYNPDDQLSQWIEPLGGGSTPPGWYIYRTHFAIPLASQGYDRYMLEIPGQLMVDNFMTSIYVQAFKDGASFCAPVATFTNTGGFQNWIPFKVSAPVAPNSLAHLYVVVYNNSGNATGNPTGLRIEFMNPYFIPF